MSKIKVLCLPSDRFGVGYFRSLSPHVNLNNLYGDKFDVTIDYEPYNKDIEYFKEFDIVHYSKNIGKSYDRHKEILKYLNENEIVNIMDIDDHWDLGTFHPMSKIYQQSNNKENILYNIQHADYVTTTTKLFADKISKHNKNVIIFPNAIDVNEAQFKPKPTKSDKIRFGIICGSSHEHDLELLRGLTNSLSKEVLDKSQFVLCGFDLNGNVKERNPQTGEIYTRPITPTESVWFRYEMILTDNYKLVSPEYRNFLLKFLPNVDYPLTANETYRRCWTKNVHQYATHYNNIDVLLAPLKECDFNYYKSQLKVIEAGFFNKAIIAQDFGAYQIDCIHALNKDGSINKDGNALLVDSKKNHKLWAKYITKLVNEPELLAQLQNNLHETVKDKYSIEAVTKERAEFYESLIKTE